MAYTFENFYRPRGRELALGRRALLGALSSRWPRHNLTYLWEHPYSGLYLVGGYLALFLIRSRGDRFVRFFRAAAVASILLDALQPNYTAMRLELTFVPIAAAGPRRRPHRRPSGGSLTRMC